MPSSADSGTLCRETQLISPNETRNVGINFIPKLRPGNLLSGTPVITISPSGPTIANEQVNTVPIVISGKTVPVGMAVLCTVSGCTLGVDYILTALCPTDETPAEMVEATADLRCRT